MEGMSDSLLDAVAICGFSFRLPGNANTPEKLWEILSTGRQCWTDVPKDRYNWEAFHNHDADARGTHNARGGFFLDEDVSNFDAQFFNISAAEAAAIDPQQRMLLEVSYEALENAGMPIEGLRGSQTGVYVALVSRDYDRQIYKDPSLIPRHHLTGCGDATACGRISYCFDFKGPSMSIDTGCSGGMVGVHLACQALLLGEAKMALVGGTNLLLGPDMTVAMSNLHMINDNGRCFPFDSRGQGYGRAEGVAVMVLKKLSDAMRDGDDIRAVIRGSGVGQDGKTNGILLPSSRAQQQLAASLYEKAGIDPQSVGYIEAHGTGTQAGDAAEIKSIREVFIGDQQRRESPLFVGSVKGNLGHSESTSGLAGIIKAVLCLEKSLIPPVAELVALKEDVSKAIQDNNGILIPRNLQHWPHTGVRRSSVNSFGYGGTNAHVILESAPETPTFPMTNGITNGNLDHRQDLQRVQRVARVSKPRLLVVSSKSKASLLRTIENVKTWIGRHGDDPGLLRDVAWTLNIRRSLLSWRSSIVCSPESNESAFRKARVSKVSITPHAIFVFSGQGAQYACMGRELLLVNTAFRTSLQKSQCVLQDLGASWNLLDELQAPESLSRINSSELSQPTTTAIQIALVDLLRDLNVLPAAVIGHSSGEVAAAYACGALTREDALKISYYKGFVAGWCKEVASLKRGAMMAVGLSENETARYLNVMQAGHATVACVNSPSSVTVSGDESAVLGLKTILDKDSVFNRLLKVDIAYHSQHMTAISARFERSISNINVGVAQPHVKFFSSVSASQHESDITHSYWVDNLVSKVRFSEALELLVESYRATGSEAISFLEIGPHAALQGPIRQTMAALKSEYPKWSYSSTLLRGQSAQTAILETMGSLFEQGVPLNLTKVDFRDLDEPPTKFKLVRDFSSYAWDHSSHWHESRLSREYRFRRHAPHDLLGLRMTGTTTLEPIFRHILSVDDLPWLQEHMIDGFALYPGSAFLIQAIEGLKQISQDRGETRNIAKYALRDMTFSKALVVPDSPAMAEVLLSFKPSGSSNERLGLEWQEFRVSSQSQDGTWNEHCKGLIRAIFESGQGLHADRIDWEEESMVLKKRIIQAAQSCDIEVPTSKLYEDLRTNGVDYGENFSIIKNLVVGDHLAVGTVQIPDIQKCMPSGRVQRHVIHPAVFDAFMHIALPLYHRRCSEGPVMLTSIREAMISAEILNSPGDQFVVECELTQAKRRFGAVNVSVYQSDPQGRPREVASLTGEEFRSIGEGQKEGNLAGLDHTLCYSVDWIPTDRIDPSIVQPNLDDVRVYSTTESSPAQDLALELSSRFGNQRNSNTVTCQSKYVGLDSIIVMIDDRVDGGFHPEFLPTQTAGSETQSTGGESVIWVTIDSAAKGDLKRVSTNILARREKLRDQRLTTLTYLDTPGNGDNIATLVAELIHRSFCEKDDTLPLEINYAYRHGALLVPKMGLHEPSNSWLSATQNKDLDEEFADFHIHGRALKLDFKTPGFLNSARFVESREMQAPLASDEVDVKIYALAVNQTDVSVSLGRAESTETMPGEFSGIVIAAGTHARVEYSPGDRVCGWGPITPYANNARIKSHLLQRISESLSYVEGATIPLAFQTAYHTLVDIARLERSQKLLIHGAAGGVGQAAIQLARYIGAEVYATVSSEAKVQILTESAGIPRQHIFSSRSTAFQEDITRLTKGSGVDVVLNCCSMDLAEASLACVAEFGFLINVVKSSADISPRFRRNVSIVSIDMAIMKDECPQKVNSKFKKVMNLYNTGVLQPMSSTTFPISDLVDAFKLVNSQNYAGKVILTAEAGHLVKQTVQVPQAPRLNSEGTYVVYGGSVDLNLSLCVFLADRGAQNIFSIIFAHTNQQRQLKQCQELRERNVRWGCVDLQHSDSLLTQELVMKSLEGFPPVQGMLKIEMGFEDIHTDDIACNTVLRDTENNICDTHLNQSALFGSPLEFCITLSPIKATPKCEEHAQVSKSFLHGEAMMPAKTSITRSIRLRLPQIEGARPSTSLIEHREGPIIRFDELCAVIDYCFSKEVTREEPLELFVPGTNGAQTLFDWEDPLFSTISRILVAPQEYTNGQPTESVEQKLTHAQNEEEGYKVIADAICEQLSSFCAIDREDMRMSTAIADVGLDSLLAIEFKNWVVRTIQAPMQTTEILDARSLHELILLISKRSKLTVQSSERLETLVDGHDETHESAVHRNGDSSIVTKRKLPPLPIPNLDSLIQRHLSYVKAFATDEEFQNTLRLAEDFKTAGNMGSRLHQRLEEMKKADPENWYHNLYLRSQYLGRKGALAPYMLFFFTHPLILVKQSQAERAALVTSVLIQYKEGLDNGKIKPKVVNEQELCMSLYQNLFNTCRQPRHGLDTFNNYPGNDFFVVLRRGRAYKVEFSHTSKDNMQNALENTFESILEASEEHVDWFGILTADHRVLWANNYQNFLQISPENAEYIATLEKCAFLICLDDGAPETAEQRARQVHFSDGSNRWFDKPIQYVVCANGVSGIVADHTGLDAPTVQEINMNIAAAIDSFKKTVDRKNDSRLPFAEMKHTTSDDIEAEVQKMRTKYLQIVAKQQHFFPTPVPFGASFMKCHRVPPNSGFQLVVQLAARYFFGYSPACWETVLQSTFHKGRVEINQIVTEKVAKFVTAVFEDTVPLAACKRLFIDAALAHSGTVLACTRAGGSDRFMCMLREIVEEGEEEPALYSDPVYKRSRPRKMMSSCFKTHMAENGCVMKDEDAIWLHFEVEMESVKFCGLGLEGQRFTADLHRAAEKVRSILDA